MDVFHPNKENFEDLLKSKELLVVDFFATWCGPCKILAPTIEELAKKADNGVRIAKVDVDENEELATNYDIQAVPTIIFFKNAQEVNRITGVVSLEKIEEIIENCK